MKRIPFALALLLLWVTASLAAGTCGTVTHAKGASSNLYETTVTWTDDTAGTTCALFGSLPVGVAGVILAVVTDPGATAPTDNYDLTITDPGSRDVMGGALANRDTTTTETAAPALSDATPWLGPFFGRLTLNVSGNAVNNATGTVKILWERK